MEQLRERTTTPQNQNGKLSRSNSSERNHSNNGSSTGSMHKFTPDKGANLESISEFIHDPICAGFLFKYSEAHYCSESIRFIVEVDKFKDLFLPEHMFWHKSWKELDVELDMNSTGVDRINTKDRALELQQMLDTMTLTDDKTWPSKKIPRTAVESMAKSIWETFLSDKAEYQIFVPSKVLWNTMRRMKYIHLYGKEVFIETLHEPIRTICRDIYPRFRGSEHMKALRRRMLEIQTLPPSSELQLPALPMIIATRYTLSELQNGVPLTLQDMLEDRVCFREFFRYLQSGIVSENLRFIRALQVYKLHINSRDKAQRALAIEWAWRIYKFFIAPYSAYEISVADTTRRDIMRQLADPTPTMFDTLERTTMDMLRVHFNLFRNKKEYAALNGVLLDAVEFQGDDHSAGGRGIGPRGISAGSNTYSKHWTGCFGLG